ncbi:MAG TPA: aminotransferase class I/II-fold pyridoxal phosphate-dependent enzyme, partial [Novosphingobium sp.]|nr:aminotransferase class I/II-fold pyridoxal phosphate-dependent enzyme [Novosphingobium sp.]
MKTADRIHPVYARMERTVFDRMSALAREHGAINLGQGFPDGPVPEPLIEAAARALREKSNQYPPGPGLIELREAICGYYARRQGLALTPEQVTVTSGATEAIAAAVLALVQPGDEVILFQPAYDAYAPMVRRAGGVPVSVPLAPPHFRYGEAALLAAITPRTRVLMLNDPLNPAGTVASPAELAMIARACVAHDLVAICDEVWEDVRFDGLPHRSLTSLPGMAAASSSSSHFFFISQRPRRQPSPGTSGASLSSAFSREPASAANTRR